VIFFDCCCETNLLSEAAYFTLQGGSCGSAAYPQEKKKEVLGLGYDVYWLSAVSGPFGPCVKALRSRA
jgi:hypothetical protein